MGHTLGFSTTVIGAGILVDDPQLTPWLAGGLVCFSSRWRSLLILGLYTRLGALMLIIFLIPATRLHGLIMEMAANGASILSASADDKAQQSIETLRNIAMQGHQANVMKNIVLILVVFTILGRGAGPLSLDGRLRKKWSAP